MKNILVANRLSSLHLFVIITITDNEIVTAILYSVNHKSVYDFIVGWIRSTKKLICRIKLRK